MVDKAGDSQAPGADGDNFHTLAKQSSSFATNEDELAKHNEELKKLEAELEENKGLVDELQSQQNNNPEAGDAGAAGQAAEPQDDPDERSVFVKNVDFSADEQSLIDHFKLCGEIVRVTIRKNPHTQQPLGFAFIEFASKESSIKAKHLNESLFKGRQLTVMPKRKNKPGMSRGRGFGGGANPLVYNMMQMLRVMGRGRGGFRGRGFRGGRGRGGGPPGGSTTGNADSGAAAGGAGGSD